ncbi:MAG TPA: pyridoxal-phosphate dependent enzyme [Jatrophihabitans sp.]|jgi:threonine dehydratase
MTNGLTFDDIRAAAARLDGVAHHTPVVTSHAIDGLVGASVFGKAENLQRAGAFKFRGAYNRISHLSPDERERGVCAWSSGNHAQAVALAARVVGTSAVILMPEDAPASKRAATEGYGADVRTYDRYRENREELAAALAAETGRVAVPPYDDHRIMAGQGTAALELLQDVSDLDTLLVPMSGGGLMAGCGVAARALNPRIELVGVEPAAGNDTKQSLVAGERIRIAVPRTIADGLQVEIPGELTFEINRRQVDDVCLVDDEQIVAAMQLLFERAKTVVEPSGATAFAALLSDPSRFAGRRVGVLLSGGNVGTAQFSDLMQTYVN